MVKVVVVADSRGAGRHPPPPPPRIESRAGAGGIPRWTHLEHCLACPPRPVWALRCWARSKGPRQLGTPQQTRSIVSLSPLHLSAAREQVCQGNATAGWTPTDHCGHPMLVTGRGREGGRDGWRERAKWRRASGPLLELKTNLGLLLGRQEMFFILHHGTPLWRNRHHPD